MLGLPPRNLALGNYTIPIGAVAGLPVHRVHRVRPAHDVVHAGVVPGSNNWLYQRQLALNLCPNLLALYQ